MTERFGLGRQVAGNLEGPDDQRRSEGESLDEQTWRDFLAGDGDA